jgi:hypothetical protein
LGQVDNLLQEQADLQRRIDDLDERNLSLAIANKNLLGHTFHGTSSLAVGLGAFPGAVADTFADGSAADSFQGFTMEYVHGMSMDLLPGGENVTPMYGHTEAYNQGRMVGMGTATLSNMVMLSHSLANLPRTWSTITNIWRNGGNALTLANSSKQIAVGLSGGEVLALGSGLLKLGGVPGLAGTNLYMSANELAKNGGLGNEGQGNAGNASEGQGSNCPPSSPNSRSPQFSKTTTPWQRNVHQRSDIDWELMRPDGLTNSQAARRGYSPMRKNPQTGKWDDITLHHLNDDPRGGLVEVWRSTHGRFHKSISREPNPWRTERPDWANAWNNEQSAYWRWRTGSYNPQPTSKLQLPGDP